MIDIERSIPGWIVGDVNLASGNLVNAKTECSANFGPVKFDFTVNNPEDIKEISASCQKLWDLIRTNLGLNEIIRIGCRFQFLLAKKDTEEAERAIAKSSFNIQFPADFSQHGYKPIVRQPTAIISMNDVEYRLVLQGMTRHEGTSPSPLLVSDPKHLSQGQQAARLEILKRKARLDSNYSKNPFYAINLDVDCATYGRNINPQKFMISQNDIVRRDFLPILEAL